MIKITTKKQQGILLENLSKQVIQRSLSNRIHYFKFVDDYIANVFFSDLYQKIKKSKTNTLNILTDFTEEDFIGNIEIEKGRLLSCLIPISSFTINPVPGVSISKEIETSYKQSSERNLLDADKGDLIIMIKYWDFLSEVNRSILTQLLSNINAYEKKYNKKIAVFVKITENFRLIKKSLNSINYEIYMFEKLSLEDSIQILLEEVKNYETDNLKKLYFLLNGSIDRMLYYMKSNININDAIKGELNNIIKNINKKIREAAISNIEYLELMSIMPDYFDPYQLCYIDEDIKIKDINVLIDILCGVSMLFQEDDYYYHLFYDLKQNLLNMHKSKRKLLYQKYYKYLDMRYPKDYFKKLNIITECIEDIQQIMAIFCLAYENSLRDKNEIECNEIKEQYKLLVNQDYLIFNYICDSLTNSSITSLLADLIENKKYSVENPLLKSFILKNDILKLSESYRLKEEFEDVCLQLYQIIEDNQDTKTEKFHYVICSFILLPHLLDKFNDRNKFKNLSKIVDTLSNSNNTLSEDLKYYKNIMLRKSFYNNHIKTSKNNYNSALNYFREINDVREEYMTMSGLIGIYIILGEYENAKKLYYEILNLKKTYSHYDYLFPQFYKTENNKIILDYFSQDVISYKHISSLILNLEKLLSRCIGTSYGVVCTNICSLSLLVDDYIKYEKYKQLFEKYNNIEDVADINDSSIDDFYRYYFSWFELGKNIINKKDVEKAKRIYESLKDFIPEIFLVESAALNKKYNIYGGIFNEEIHNGQQFNDFAKNTRNNYPEWKFYARGFMLSDLQHTSIF